MNCYYCEKSSGPGGTHLHVATAVGICRRCGTAVCVEHGVKGRQAGAMLLCRDCATFEAVPSTVERETAEAAAA